MILCVLDFLCQRLNQDIKIYLHFFLENRAEQIFDNRNPNGVVEQIPYHDGIFRRILDIQHSFELIEVP